MKHLILFSALLCSGQLSFGQMPGTPLEIETDSVNDLALESEAGVFRILTEGPDPYLITTPLEFALMENQQVLAFDYFCPGGIDFMQIWFEWRSPPERSGPARRLGNSEGWVSFSMDLGEEMADWGKRGDVLRLDLGGVAGVQIQLKNLQIRARTLREKEIAATREEKLQEDAGFHASLEEYLASDYPSRVTRVEVAKERVKISGDNQSGGTLFLVEIPPYADVSKKQEFQDMREVDPGGFELQVERYAERHGFRYDRLLSRWVLFKNSGEVYKLASHARYAEKIPGRYDLKDEKAEGKKGLGGFSTRRGHVEDLKDLDITSATVNIWFTRFMYTTPSTDRIEHSYSGKSYYFDRRAVEGFDKTLRTAAENNIIVAAILLVSKEEQCPDPEIGRVLQHPDMDPAGIYSMPNMTTPESVNAYAAALDFLASRYSRPDKKFGRIHHWIMHNEVDAGWVWTNMGEKTDLVFMDAYIKSMRLCYHIARSYNPHSEVFISLTHYWAWTSDPHFYPSRDLLNILLDYSRVEGDFQWAVAHHPYPESLFEPKTWLDQKVDFTFDSPLITFKNLEVLDAWIKKPEVLYQGSRKRTLWLSENGTNSKTYKEIDLQDQAAGFAYAWKKMKTLDGIDGFQWHNWFDGRGEGGLRIGLRRFPDDENDPGGKKPVWYVYQAADTENEDPVFDPYREAIGIDSWSQLIYQGEIDLQKRDTLARNLMADTWVATDALGRKLPGYEESGPVNDNRHVGMFYFMTHLDPHGPGPYDVTRIKAANPENPEWGLGSHFWGEPEIGYYLNNEAWAIRRHARQL
ncbi:MAG: hypothetical protein GY790_22020, partial [Bacteroidetes bacterium]|nr:hypothetical protein [Bacteroidota bacterium]